MGTYITIIKFIRTYWKKFLVYTIRLYRAFGLTLTAVKTAKTKQDRMLMKIVTTLLENPTAIIKYFPQGPRVLVYTGDLNYIVSITRYEIKITDQNLFFDSYISDTLSENLMQLALVRLEEEFNFLEKRITGKGDAFLDEIYTHFKISE